MEQENKKLIDLLEGSHIYNLLKPLKGIKTYPLIAPENSAASYIVYRRTGLVPTYVLGRDIGTINSRYEILVISNEYSKGLDYTKQILNLLSNYKDSNINDIEIENLTEDYNDTLFIQEIIIKITT